MLLYCVGPNAVVLVPQKRKASHAGHEANRHAESLSPTENIWLDAKADFVCKHWNRQDQATRQAENPTQRHSRHCRFALV